MRIRPLVVIALVALVALPSVARAQSAEPRVSETVNASLVKYDEGRRAYHAKDYRAALAAFEASLALQPSPNTRLYVGRCLRELGYVARARAALKLAAAEATDLVRHNRQDRYTPTIEAARAEAEALSNRVPHLSIAVPADAPPDLVVRVNGAVMPKAVLGDLEVDPGEVTVEATAETVRAVRIRLHLNEGQRETTVLTLTQIPPRATTRTPLPRVDRASSQSPRPRVGVVDVVGVGALSASVVSLVVGGVMLAGALHDEDVETSKPRELRTQEERDRIADKARLSSVFLVGGALLAAGGVTVLVLGTPSRGAVVRAGVGNIELVGRF